MKSLTDEKSKMQLCGSSNQEMPVVFSSNSSLADEVLLLFPSSV